MEVSILVFVELALDATRPTPQSPEKRVSILVFVELALDVLLSVPIQGLLLQFQSLFSWNLLLMTVTRG